MMANDSSFYNSYDERRARLWGPFKTNIDRIFRPPANHSRMMNEVKEGWAKSEYNDSSEELDLNEYLVGDPENTFYVRVSGNSMIRAGIYPGDLLVVNRGIKLQSGQIVVAKLKEEMIVKRYIQAGDKKFLLPENPLYSAIEIKKGMNFSIWGVVTHLIHSFMPYPSS